MSLQWWEDQKIDAVQLEISVPGKQVKRQGVLMFNMISGAMKAYKAAKMRYDTPDHCVTEEVEWFAHCS